MASGEERDGEVKMPQILFKKALYTGGPYRA